MADWPVLTSVSRIGHGALVCTRTVIASTISTRSMGENGGDPRSLSLGSTSRSRLNFTASASIGSPLWKRTPLRSLNSHVVGATSFGISAASAGRTTSWSSRSSRVSKTLRASTPAGVSWWFMGSSVVGSTPWAITTVPEGAAAATPGTPADRISRMMRRQPGMETPLVVGADVGRC
jgi:hypothetical protein